MVDGFSEDSVKDEVLDQLSKSGFDLWVDARHDLDDISQALPCIREETSRETDQVIYWDILEEQIKKLNDKVDNHNAGDVIRGLKNELKSDGLLSENRNFYNILRNGYDYVPSNSDEDIIRVRLIGHPDDQQANNVINDNRFDAVTEFVMRRQDNIRLDVVLFVNGIPLVPIELKSDAQGTTVDEAIEQIIGYEGKEPRLFVPTLLNAAYDGRRFEVAPIQTRRKYWRPWRKDREGQSERDDHATTDDLASLLNPETLIDLHRYFVFYENDTEKIVARYMQYYAANKIVERIRGNEHDKGLIWHTQGSGKSYTMLFATYKAKKTPNPGDEKRKYLLIVDRENLEKQMSGVMGGVDFPDHVKADSIDDLEEQLRADKDDLVLTTIQKFADVDHEAGQETDRKAVIMMDEAHRFAEEKLGSYLKATLPNRIYFGFTGTPVQEGESQEDRDTFNEFSPDDEGYMDRYSLHDGQNDNVITPVTFLEPEVNWSINAEIMDQAFESEVSNDLSDEERRQLIREEVKATKLADLSSRRSEVVNHIAKHYRQNLEPSGLKGMVVTPNKTIAAQYGNELAEELGDEAVQVVVSRSPDDDAEIVQEHHVTDEKERTIIDQYKRDDSNPKLLVVCDKLLTGFDAPILKTIYLDKPLKNHRLLQAIARANRPHPRKNNGQIVDYMGVFDNLASSLEYDDDAFKERVVKTEQELKDEFQKKLNKLMNYFDGINILSGEQKEYKKALGKIKKDESRKTNFVVPYQDAQKLYESLEPHKFLARDDVERKWREISKIYDAYKRHDVEDSNQIKQELRSKTKDIIDANIEFESIDETTEHEPDISEIDNDELKHDDHELGDYEITKRANELLEKYDSQADDSPVYESLSQRVRDVLSKWRQNGTDTNQILDRLRKLKVEEDEYENKKENLGLNDTGYALYCILIGATSKHSGFIEDKKEAEEIASKLSRELDDYSDALNKRVVAKRIKGTYLSGLKAIGRDDLSENDEFIDEAVEYSMP